MRGQRLRFDCGRRVSTGLNSTLSKSKINPVVGRGGDRLDTLSGYHLKFFGLQAYYYL